jgi:hypothetical protein
VEREHGGLLASFSQRGGHVRRLQAPESARPGRPRADEPRLQSGLNQGHAGCRSTGLLFWARQGQAGPLHARPPRPMALAAVSWEGAAHAHALQTAACPGPPRSAPEMCCRPKIAPVYHPDRPPLPIRVPTLFNSPLPLTSGRHFFKTEDLSTVVPLFCIALRLIYQSFL